jgi:peptidyl-prolyl cis-trans isomerase D
MLQFMRKGFFSGLFVLFLVLAAFSIVFADWTGSFRSGPSRAYVVEVGRERIGQNEFIQTVNRMLRGQNISPDMAYAMGWITQIATQDVNRLLLSHIASNYGFAIGDSVLLAQLEKMVASASRAENIPPADILKRYIENNGMTESQFLSALRTDLKNGIVQGVITAPGTHYSPFIAKDLAKIEAQTRTFSYIVLKNDAVKGIKPPSESVFLAYYDTRKQEFMTPEARQVQIAVLRHTDIEKQVNITDSEVQKYYDDHPDEFERTEQRRVSSALFTSQEKAETFKSAVILGNDSFLASFEKEAKKIDNAATITHTESTQKDMPDAYATAVFAAAPGTVLGPINTPFGYHVIRVEASIPPGTLPFDMVQKDIQKALLDEKKGAVINEKLERLQSATENQIPFSDILTSEKGLSVITEKTFTAGETAKIEGLADQDGPAVTNALFAPSITTSGIVAPIELPSGDIALANIVTLTPATAKPLANIRDILIKDWVKRQREQLNQKQAQDSLKKLITGQMNLEKLSNTLKTVVHTVSSVSKQDIKKAPDLDPMAYNRFFEQAPKTPILTPTTDGFAIGIVDDISFQDGQDIPKTLIEDIERNQQNELMLLTLGHYRDVYGVRINTRLLEEMFAKKKDDPSTP